MQVVSGRRGPEIMSLLIYAFEKDFSVDVVSMQGHEKCRARMISWCIKRVVLFLGRSIRKCYPVLL